MRSRCGMNERRFIKVRLGSQPMAYGLAARALAQPSMRIQTDYALRNLAQKIKSVVKSSDLWMTTPAPPPVAAAPAALTPPTSLIVQAVLWLRQALADRVWRDHLPGEREFCEQVGVSRPTLRLALAQIERDGLVQVITASGTFLAHALGLKMMRWSARGFDGVV
jgi:hypothetical protein